VLSKQSFPKLFFNQRVARCMWSLHQPSRGDYKVKLVLETKTKQKHAGKSFDKAARHHM
jgi:hypothetical protein